MIQDRTQMVIAGVLGFLWSLVIVSLIAPHISVDKLLSPIVLTFQPLKPLQQAKKGNEVFGFAPNWNMDKFDNIDFDVLTTLAYFDIKSDAEGNINKDDSGYQMFKSRQATYLFKKAHEHGTRVVATLTQMDASSILSFLDNPDAQDNLINQSVNLVKKRGIDGLNVDFEYFGGAGPEYQPKFTSFIQKLTDKMHAVVPNSQVSVSLYASVVTAPRIYDLASIAQHSDLIFMMAYDYTTVSSDYAMPTAPLYGHKSGKYWYDVSTAVDDFLTKMPAKKLVLGVPYYDLNFPVEQPAVKAATLPYWYGSSQTLTYDIADKSITPAMDGVTEFLTGWDDEAKVSWKAYYNPSTGWRMQFVEDTRSLAAKYDFAKSRNLGGVGMWALGNEGNAPELWQLLKNEFGVKYADNNVQLKFISDENI